MKVTHCIFKLATNELLLLRLMSFDEKLLLLARPHTTLSGTL